MLEDGPEEMKIDNKKNCQTLGNIEPLKPFHLMTVSKENRNLESKIGLTGFFPELQRRMCFA